MLVDSSARKSALKIENKLVKAPAGSGKTALLTNYFLKLLGVVEHPRQIAAMTFTNKARREMAVRVIESMERVESGFVPTNDYERENYTLAKAALENSKSRGWGLEQNVNMLQVSTIDSFCKQLLVNNIGSDQEMLATRNIAKDPYLLYERAVRETLSLYSHAVHGPAIQKLVMHFDNKIVRVQRLLIEMLETRERWMPALFESKLSTKEKLESERKEFVEYVFSKDMDFINTYEPQLQHIVSQLNVSDEPLIKFVKDGFSEELNSNRETLALLGSVFTTKVGKAKKRFTKNDGIPEELSKADRKLLVEEMTDLSNMLAEKLHSLGAIPGYQFGEGEWVLLDSVFDVMPLLLANLKIVFKQVGQIDFTEIALNALSALNSVSGNETDAAINKSQTIKHILVDEFQDSNDTQLVMLKLLIESWADLEGNSLFLVGDAMQSLYGFRGANVNVFMGAEDGIGHIPLNVYELKTNFRSTTGVVDWVNKVFSQAFPKENNMLLGASRYNESSAVKITELPGDSVEVHGFIDDVDSVVEARFIVDEISKIQISEPNAKIAILGRTRSALDPVMTELSGRKDVGALAVDVNKIDKEAICITAIALARVLIDDLDKLAWIEVLNSGLVGLSHSDIERMLNIDRDPFVAITSDKAPELLNNESKPRFNYFVENIEYALESKHSRPIDQILSGLWLKLHGLSLAKTKSDVENVKSVFSIFTGCEYTEVNLAWFERKLESLYSKPNKEMGGLNANVELMTIHKSKGLEFDYVFIPGMHKRGPSGTSRLLSWSPIGGEQGSSVMATSEALGVKLPEVNYHGFLNKLKANREMQELIRLAYVAATRAIKKAYLTGGFTSKADGVNSPSKGSLLSTIFKGCADQIMLHQGNSVEKRKVITPMISKIEADLTLMLPERNTLAAYRGTKQSVPQQDTMKWVTPISRIEGIVIHQMIEQINLDGVEKWNDQRVDNYSSVILASLKELSLERDHLLKSVNKIKSELKQLLSCEDFRILASKHSMSDVELKLSLKRNRKVVMLQIDKCFVDENGGGHIIDWKSANQPSDQSLPNFMNNQKMIYREKMKAYGEAYKEVYGLNTIETALYFTKLNSLQECG